MAIITTKYSGEIITAEHSRLNPEVIFRVWADNKEIADLRLTWAQAKDLIDKLSVAADKVSESLVRGEYA